MTSSYDSLQNISNHLGKLSVVVWWLACWLLVPEFAGSNPAEAVGFFQ
jgi:hypothetical protein